MQLVCFGPDTLSCVYVWVKVRSVSAALVETHMHLLCLPLCQTHSLCSLIQTHTHRHTDVLAGPQILTVRPCLVECGLFHLSKVSAAHTLCKRKLPPSAVSPPALSFAVDSPGLTSMWAAWEISTSLRAGS